MRTTLPVVLLAAALALVACGDDSGSAGQASATTTLAPTTVAAGIPAPDTAPVPPSAPAGSPSSVPDAAPDAVAAWMGFAGALAGGDLDTARAATRDAANSFLVVTQVVADHDAAEGNPHGFAGEIGPATVAGAEGGRIRLSATLLVRETSPAGLDRALVITDPVLRDYGGMWAVETFSLDGAPLRFTPVGQSATTDGVTMELLAVLDDGVATWCLTRTTVQAGEVALRAGASSVLDTEGNAHPGQASVFTDDQRPVGAWRFPRVAQVVRVDLGLVDEAGSTRSFAFGGD